MQFAAEGHEGIRKLYCSGWRFFGFRLSGWINFKGKLLGSIHNKYCNFVHLLQLSGFTYLSQSLNVLLAVVIATGRFAFALYQAQRVLCTVMGDTFLKIMVLPNIETLHSTISVLWTLWGILHSTTLTAASIFVKA